MNGTLAPPERPLRAVTLLLAALSGCAGTMTGQPSTAPELATGPQCFLPQQINGYSEAPDGPDGEERLYVHTGAHDRWLVDAGACPDLDFSNGIGLDTRFNGTRLCAGETATLVVPRGGAGAPDHCEARLLGKLVRG